MDDVKGLCERTVADDEGYDLVSRAEVLRVLRRLGEQDADLALYGAEDNARAREYGEAAMTRACCAVAIMPAATALTAAQARIRELEAQVTAYEAARSAEPVAVEARTAPIPVAVVLAAEAKLRAHPTPEAPMSDLTEEEIARAICAAEGLDPDNVWSEGGTFWEDYLPQARAVIALVLPAIERARVEERERAAKIAESCGDTWSGSRCVEQAVQEAAADEKAAEIAAAIRKG